LCWGRAKDEDTQSVNLRECIGITYGPVTTTFQRCHTLEDPAWSCFSLLFMGRTLDLTVNHEVAVQQWLLGLQHLISLHGIGSMPPMSTAKFLLMKVQLKLQVAAHQHRLVMGRYLVERVRELAGLGTSTALAAGNGGGGGCYRRGCCRREGLHRSEEAQKKKQHSCRWSYSRSCN